MNVIKDAGSYIVTYDDPCVKAYNTLISGIMDFPVFEGGFYGYIGNQLLMVPTLAA